MPVLKNFVDLGQPKPNSMTYMSKELYTKEHTLASRSDASAKYDTLHYLLTPRLTGYEGWGGELLLPSLFLTRVFLPAFFTFLALCLFGYEGRFYRFT